jgi:uncharacterized protein (PEP-CTERM system associated)
MTARARNLQCALLTALASLIFSPLSPAANITLHPSLSTYVSRADNVTLAPEGEEQRETVVSVAPSLSATGQGSHLDFELLYGFESLFYLDNSRFNGVRHLLRGDATATIEEDLFYLDASAWIRRQPVDPSTTAGLGDIAVNENAGSGYRSVVSVSPYLTHTFGTIATVRGGLTFDYLGREANEVDSYGRAISLSAESGPFLGRVAWDGSASSKDVFYRNDPNDFSVQTIDVGVQYSFVAQWAVLARAGYLNYDVSRDSTVENEPEGTTWRIGLSWSPSSGTIIRYGVGEHYFGRLKFLNLDYHGQLTFVTASYDESVSTLREAELVSSSEVVSDPVTGQPSDPTSAYQTRDTVDVYVTEIGTVSVGYRSSRLETTVTFRREHRRFETRNGEETVRGGGATIRRNITPRTSVIYGYSKTTRAGISEIDEVHIDAKLALVREVSTRLQLSLDAQRVARSVKDSTDSNDYVARVYSLRATVNF